MRPQPVSIVYCVRAMAPSLVAPVLAFTPRSRGSGGGSDKRRNSEKLRAEAVSVTESKGWRRTAGNTPSTLPWGLRPVSRLHTGLVTQQYGAPGAGLRAAEAPSGCGKP